MILTTLGYIEQNGKYLMLHRVKKAHDVNHDKWIGIGGKLEHGESPDECMRREAREETGLELSDLRFRGVVTFVADGWEPEQMFLFTCDRFTGELIECDEGELAWVDRQAMYDLPIWEGDKIFLRLLEQDAPVFLLKLRYQGDTLVEAVLNGQKIR
jgi:8-oxo-dGTP diphosphatase